MERKLDYFKLVIPEIVEIGMQQFIAIVLSIKGYGVISLFYGFVIGRIVALLLFYILQPWSFGFAYKWKEIIELRKFGFSYQIFQLIGVVSGIVAPIIVGSIVGTQALGLVTWAGGVSALSLTFSEIIGRALFMLGSRFQKNRDVLVKTIEISVQITYLISLPINFLIISLAGPITFIIFTDKWHAGIGLIYIYSIQAVFMTSVTILNQVLLAIGQSKIVRNINFYKIILHWFLGFILTIKFGMYGFAISSVITSLVFIPLLMVLKQKLPIYFFKNTSTYFIISGLAALIIYYIQLVNPVQTVLQLIMYSGFGIFLYFGILAMINFASLKHIYRYSRNLLLILKH